MTSSERVAVLGTGLIGTSIAMAALRSGDEVRAFDVRPDVLEVAAARAPGLVAATTLEACVDAATLVFVCAPVPAIAHLAVDALRGAPHAVVTDVGSVKAHVMVEVERRVGVERAAGVDLAARFVGGHPMGGSERSGPEAASPAVLDGAVWALTPSSTAAADTVATLRAWIRGVGANPVEMAPERHDRLVAFVSHLPQVASTALMGLAATEEAGEPDILLLAAGGFRDLTRLAASSPHLWSDILLANGGAVADAIDLYVERLSSLRRMILDADASGVERSFEEAKRARLSLSPKPQVRTGVAVLQVPIPDRPGALADLTAALGGARVNIEDLQIVHSPEGGRGTVHLTVGATSAATAMKALADAGFEPIRLA